MKEKILSIIYAALNERDDDIFAGWSDPAQIAKNEAMLVNLFDPLVASAKGFRHISGLVQNVLPRIVVVGSLAPRREGREQVVERGGNAGAAGDVELRLDGRQTVHILLRLS